MTHSAFKPLPGPQACTDQLLGWFTRLGFEREESTLAQLCVTAAAQLSECDLCQLYAWEETTGQLGLIAQYFPDGEPSGERAATVEVQHQQLLHYVLNQGRELTIDELCNSAYDSGFLPVATLPWHALTCLPLFNRSKAVCGVLLCASLRPTQLQGYAVSLGQLGSFALG